MIEQVERVQLAEAPPPSHKDTEAHEAFCISLPAEEELGSFHQFLLTHELVFPKSLLR